MKRIVISGTWQHTNEQVERDVREAVRDIMQRGDAIVVGGALGVDYFATDEALKIDRKAERITVIIPTSLDEYAEHLRKRAAEGVISFDSANKLTNQLRHIADANPTHLISLNLPENTHETYRVRNTALIENGDALIAFQVNGSMGTGDTIAKAGRKGIPVDLRSYDLQPAAHMLR